MAYRRLIPRERSILTWAELWAEDDHLLSVRSHRLSSQYQRFPLSEIQAVSVTELPHWTISQIGWLASSTLLLGVSVLAPTLTALRFFFGIFTVWPFLFALQEVLRGPRCRTTIHTVTGAHVLAAVGRMKRGQIFLDTVTPLIEGVQGRAEQIEVSARAVAHPEEEARVQLQHHRPLRLISFGLLLIAAVFSLVSWKWPRLLESSGVGILAVGLTVTSIALLLVIWKNAAPVLRKDRAYVLSGAALGLILAEFVVAFVWIVTLMRGAGGIENTSSWIGVGGAAWRIPLALAGLAVEFRRK